MKGIKVYHHALLYNYCSIRVYYRLFTTTFHNALHFPIILDIFNDLLCSKLCWHNRQVPIPKHGMPNVWHQEKKR